MKIKIIICLSIFFVTLASAAVETAVIPPIIVKKPKHSISSGSQETITQTEIVKSGITTLGQVLQNLGGIQLQDLTGNSSQVLLSLRGFGANASSNTLMLLNGIPLVNPDLAPPDLNAIPLTQIKSIAITAGSESVLYGDQAVGGVIDIETGFQTTPHYVLACLGGSYNQANCSLAINQVFQRLQYNLLLNRNQTDNYRDHNEYWQNMLSGNALYPYSTGRLQLFGNVENEYMQFPGALTAGQVRQDRQQASNTIDYFKDQNGFLNLHWQQLLTDAWSIKIDAAHRQMSGNGVLTVPFTQGRSTNYIKPQFIGTNDHIWFFSGIELQQDNYDLNSSFGKTNNNQQKYSVFALSNFKVSEKWQLSLGVRGAIQDDQLMSYLDQDSINRAFVTTAGISFDPDIDTSFYLRRAGSYRFPKADENATAPIGVSSLQTQRGESYEAGLEKQIDNLNFKANLYQLNLQDEIAFDPTQTPQQPFGSNRNLPPTVRRGLNLIGKAQLNKQIQISSQLNVLQAVFQNGVNAGNRIPLVSEAIAHAGINYTMSDYWQLYGEAVFTGNQFTANDDANVGVRQGGYTLYNLNLRYAFKSFSASLHLNNIFNKYYYFYTVYQPGDPSEFYYPAPGRNVTLYLSYAI